MHTMAAPQVLPRKHSLLKNPDYSPYIKVNGNKAPSHVIHAEREVELLNHCIADVEGFMGQLQQASNAHIAREQSLKKKKKSKKNNKKSKKKNQDYEVMNEETNPAEQEFVDIFQKMKYSFSLLDRLKSEISDPSSVDILHHMFVPLRLMVKTTGGPELAASVSSPVLTSGAVSLLQQNLNQSEMDLWNSLGPNWNQPFSQPKSVPPYTPVFQDGWQPAACGADGHPYEDPVQSQLKYEAQINTQQQDPSQASHHMELTDESMENPAPLEVDRFYRCSYDFVARNSSELSVLHGEMLQVLESTKRWWKCRNRYDEIGFVPSNILEPVSHSEVDGAAVMRQQSMKLPLSPPGGGRFSYAAPPSSSGEILAHSEPRPVSMPPIGDDGYRVDLMNSELAQRLAIGRTPSARPLVINRANETSAPLNYHSPPNEVKEWLKAKGFSDQTANSLGVLSGAQLFSLNKEELCTVSPLEGARVYSQIMVQKAQLESVRKASELEAVMKRQKMKVDHTVEGEL